MAQLDLSSKGIRDLLDSTEARVTVVEGAGGGSTNVTTAVRLTLTPAQGAQYYDTDLDSFWIGDGVTLGGVAQGGGGAHLLGSATHTADTLANLNAKVSDATLLDETDIVRVDGSNAQTLATFTPGAAPGHTEGQVYYDSTEKALSVDVSDGSTISVGQEVVIRVLNKTGVQINDGQVVYTSGAQGNRPTVELADADLESTSEGTIGIATADIANNQEGFITHIGLVRGLDTTGGGEVWAAGERLYLSSTPGVLTNVLPVAPTHGTAVGWVLNAHATQGILLVNINDQGHLQDLHDANIDTPLDGEVLTYVTANSRWENVAAAGGGAPNGDTILTGPTTDTIDSTTDGMFWCDALLGVITITLDAAAPTGYEVKVADSTGSATTANITVQQVAAETINGAASYTLTENWQSITLRKKADGNWGLV
jgi:hypothetical protein